MLLYLIDDIDENLAKSIDRELWSVMNIQSNMNVRRLMENFVVLLAKKFKHVVDGLEKYVLLKIFLVKFQGTFCDTMRNNNL